MPIGATIEASTQMTESPAKGVQTILTQAGSLESGWSTIVEAGGVSADAGGPPRNILTHVTRTTTKILRKNSGLGSVLLLQLGVPAATASVSVPLTVRVFGRRSGSGNNWTLLRNPIFEIDVTLAMDIANDAADGDMIWSTVDISKHAFDVLGFDEFVVAQSSSLALVGAAAAGAVIRGMIV
jgi:hypothetical protein